MTDPTVVLVGGACVVVVVAAVALLGLFLFRKNPEVEVMSPERKAAALEQYLAAFIRGVPAVREEGQKDFRREMARKITVLLPPHVVSFYGEGVEEKNPKATGTARWARISVEGYIRDLKEGRAK